MSIFKNRFELATKFSTEIFFLVEKEYLNSMSAAKSRFFQEYPSAEVFCPAVEEGNEGNVCGLPA